MDIIQIHHLIETRCLSEYGTGERGRIAIHEAMNPTRRRRLEALNESPHYTPVKGSPGNWTDAASGEIFHYTQFYPIPACQHHRGKWK